MLWRLAYRGVLPGYDCRLGWLLLALIARALASPPSAGSAVAARLPRRPYCRDCRLGSLVLLERPCSRNAARVAASSRACCGGSLPRRPHYRDCRLGWLLQIVQ
jgi:hypothetical protein